MVLRELNFISNLELTNVFFIMEISSLDYINVLNIYIYLYLLGNLPFFKIPVNCFIARHDSPCSNAVSK